MSPRERIRVLVIDDSAYSRRAITRILGRSPLVEVIGVARDGREALRKTLECKPDLVTLDLDMPQMDGFTYLRLVMTRCPTPVIVVSGRSAAPDVFRALDFGAVDFVAKPTPHASPTIETIEEELLAKVHAVHSLRLDKVRARLGSLPRPAARLAQRPPGAPRVVAIASSTGGPGALLQVLGSFLEAPPVTVLVAQHMPRGFTRGFAERIAHLTPFAASEAADGMELAEGHVYIAPGGSHLEVERAAGAARLRVLPRRPEDRYVPSGDRLFRSAAKHFGPRLLAIVLTGMGSDGSAGVRDVKANGGSVVVEAEESAVVFGMPRQALRSGAVDAVLPLDRIPAAIQRGLRRDDRDKRGRRGGR